MARSTHLLCLSTVLLTVIVQNEAQPPPRITGSFRAIGEMTIDPHIQPPLSPNTFSMVFEELYHAGRKMSANYLVEQGSVEKYLEIQGLNRTFVYDCIHAYQVTDKPCTPSCRIVTPEEWEKITDSGIQGYKTEKGRIVFLLRELLMLDESALIGDDKPKEITYRNIPAREWVYSYTTMLDATSTEKTDIRAIWSREGWATTSPRGVMPLAFSIVREVTSSIEGTPSKLGDHVILNVMHFVEDEIDETELEFYSGIVCPVESPMKFPDTAGIDAVAYGMELVMPGDEIFNSETWVDTFEKVMRIRMDPVDGANINVENEEQRATLLKQSLDIQIFYNAGIVFIQDSTKPGSCQFEKISKFSYADDPQIFFNVKNADAWNIQSMFGNTSTYQALGEARLNEVITLKYQGKRIDWPSGSPGVATLWEWYFLHLKGLEYPENKLPLLKGDVRVTGKPLDVHVGRLYEEGLKMTYNFYDVYQVPPQFMHTRIFDVASCFAANDKLFLEFQISTENLKKEVIASAVTDHDFLYTWKKSIGHGAGFNDYTYRVAELFAVYDDTSASSPKVYILFTLLGLPPNLPAELGYKEISLYSARNNLTKAVDKGLGTEYKEKMMKAVPGTLKESYRKPNIIPTPDPITDTPRTPTDRPRTTPSHITGTKVPTESTVQPVRTSSENPNTNTPGGTTSTGGTTAKPLNDDEVRHSSGTMAGVAIAMLIVGGSMGAGAIYLKAKFFDRSTI